MAVLYSTFGDNNKIYPCHIFGPGVFCVFIKFLQPKHDDTHDK